VNPSSWFETRGIADAVVELQFDGDRKGNFPKNFSPDGPWFSVPLMAVPPGQHVWDCRIILDQLEARPKATYRLDAFFLSPQLASLALPAGSQFTLFPGQIVGHGTVIEWLGG
jgi:hypothetical protein